MSLDANTSVLTRHGTVTISGNGIHVDGFDGHNCTCRDVCVLAMVWAIGKLQRELQRSIERPGGGKAIIGEAP